MHAEHISNWAANYGVQGSFVDGNDVEAVLAATRHALQVMRETGRPYLLETYTYRQKGHYSPDDQAYVDRDELSYWLARDPITRQQDRLRKAGSLDDAGIAGLQAEAQAAIEGAAEFALASPFPAAATLTSDVYA
jgi:pyruvate dehydrogenase E1 component alpha subunit